jgi:hypothetical protein
MGGQVMYSRFVMKFTSKDSFDWTMEAGNSESTMKQGMRGKETRVGAETKLAAAKPATQKPPSQ